MNNGHMEESTTGVAKLEHTDPRVFAFFVEITYTGMYCKPMPEALMKRSRIFHLDCHCCETSQIWSSDMPRDDGTVCCTECSMDQFRVQEFVWTGRDAELAYECSRVRFLVDFGALQEQFDVIDRWNNLSATQFHYLYDPESWHDASKLTQGEGPELTASDSKISGSGHYLDFLQIGTLPILLYAMLYVFCQEYMVDSLKRNCLKMLDKDLSRLDLNANNVADIEKLVTYIYENTTGPNEQEADVEGRMPGSNELRICILKFAVANSKELLKFASFKALLCGGGEFVVDFCEGMTIFMRCSSSRKDA